jgi:hypothetical protein
MEFKRKMFHQDFSYSNPSFITNPTSRSYNQNNRGGSKSRKELVTTPLPRKNLPQTSNIVARLRKSPKKMQIISSVFQDSSTSPRNSFETEIVTLKDNSKITVSGNLSNLLTQVLSTYPSCSVIQDTIKSNANVYKYLFNSDLKVIYSLADFQEPPVLVIISPHKKVADKSLHINSPKDKPELTHNRRCNMINMYSNVITTSKYNQKYHPNPLYKLKNAGSYSRMSKTPVPETMSSGNFKSSKKLSPWPSSKKLKEGAGGFRKPHLLFEKTRNYISAGFTSRNPSEKALKQSLPITRSIMKEIISSDQICSKYLLTKQEFINLLSDYNYLREDQGHLVKKIVCKNYNISLKTLKGIDPSMNSNKYLTWEEFVKFYVIFVLKKGILVDLVEFVVNVFEHSENSFDINKVAQYVNLCNQAKNKKIDKIMSHILEKNEKSCLSTDIPKLIQDEKLTIVDLRLLVNLIIKSYC